MHVTVLMAVFNEARSVAAAVESVRTQSHTDWDLLVVDDASTDGTSEILSGLAVSDSRISVIRNATNRGLPASLNLGWRQARSELIARLDGDDIMLPERLAQQTRFMETHRDVAVLGGGAELVDANDRRLGAAFRPIEHEELVRRILREVPFIHPSVMVRREFYEVLGGYDETLRRSQDYDLWLRGYRRFRFHNLHEPLIRYRVPGKPSMNSIFYGTHVLGRAVRREHLPLSSYWYPLRFLTANVLTKVGLWNSRLR